MGSSGVEFDTDNAGYGNRRQSSSGGIPGGSFGGNQWNPGTNQNEPKMVKWLMKHGLASTPKAAHGILIALMIVNFIITYLVISYFI